MDHPGDELKLRPLHEELTGKLVQIEATKETQHEYFQHLFKERKQIHGRMCQKSLFELNNNIEKLLKLYSIKGAAADNSDVSFFHQKTKEDFFTEEESFTSALTEYTRKQFFEGIADLAGSRDKSRYDLLDIRKPETLLIKGEKEEIKLKDKEELQRLQSLFAKNQEKRVNADMSCVSLKAKIRIAERQLEQLSSNSLDVNYLNTKFKSLSEELNQSKESLLHTYKTEFQPLVLELQNLQSTKVLQGNYDLKLARQEYFLSKQNEVINQLLIQCSRNYFLTMLYEIELKEHRNSYHLIASSKSLLETEVEYIQKRIKFLSDPLILTTGANKETISSKDHSINRLYDALVRQNGTKEQLYKTHDSIMDEASLISRRKQKLDENINKNINEKHKISKALKTTVNETYKIASTKDSQSNQQLLSMIANLEENLSVAELQVNDIIKDVVTKRKILSTDSLAAMERTLFPNFFNDPTRLKRTMNELESRVDAYKHTS